MLLIKTEIKTRNNEINDEKIWLNIYVEKCYRTKQKYVPSKRSNMIFQSSLIDSKNEEVSIGGFFTIVLFSYHVRKLSKLWLFLSKALVIASQVK